MASPRTPRSPRSRRARRPAPTSKNSSQVLAIGAGAVVVVILGAWLLNRGGGQEPARKPAAGKQPPAKNAVADKQPGAQLPAVKTSGRPGKTPDTPAPEIQETDVAKAEQLYREAKKLDLEARRAQKAGDSATFNRLINDAWDKLEAVGPLIQRYEDWYEEADLSDWAIPASYVHYRRRIEKIDKLRGRVRKVRPLRRK